MALEAREVAAKGDIPRVSPGCHQVVTIHINIHINACCWAAPPPPGFTFSYQQEVKINK